MRKVCNLNYENYQKDESGKGLTSTLCLSVKLVTLSESMSEM